MKKYHYLYLISLILIISFFAISIVEYTKYDPLLCSAPFLAYLIPWILMLILPSLIIFIIACVLRRKK